MVKKEIESITDRLFSRRNFFQQVLQLTTSTSIMFSRADGKRRSIESFFPTSEKTTDQIFLEDKAATIKAKKSTIFEPEGEFTQDFFERVRKSTFCLQITAND